MTVKEEMNMLRNELKEAVTDLRFLLGRGYNREGCMVFVGDKYQLDKEERLILYRAVYDSKTANEHARKKMAAKVISGKKVAIDGYNVVLTIEAMLKSEKLIQCDDEFFRDITGVHGKHKPTETTEKALGILVDFLKGFNPQEVVFFYDAQVSLSGEMASLTRRMLKESRLNGDARAVRQADKEALNYGEIVSSSDAVLIEKSEKLIDSAGELINKLFPEKIIKLPKRLVML
mgnify:FL=1